MRFLILFFSFFIFIGCSSSTKEHFAKKYYYYDKPIEIDPLKHNIIFLQSGQIVEPIMVVVDGKFIPVSARVASFNNIKHLKVYKFANLSGGKVNEGTQELEIEQYPAKQAYFYKGNEKLKQEVCVFGLFKHAAKYHDSLALYSNNKTETFSDYNSNRQYMAVEVGGDTYNASIPFNTLEWQTDLNGNGFKETWSYYFSFGDFQVWENFGGEKSLLLLDTARIQSPFNFWSKVTPDLSCK